MLGKLAIAAGIILASTIPSLSAKKTVFTKKNAEYLGLSIEQHRNRQIPIEFYLKSISSTNQEQVYFTEILVFPVLGNSSIHSIIVYCDKENPRVVSDYQSDAVKINLKSQNVTTQLYGRVCKIEPFRKLSHPVQLQDDDDIPFNNTIDFDPSNQFYRKSLNPNTHVYNAFNSNMAHWDKFINYYYCNGPYSGLVVENNSIFLSVNELVSKLTSASKDDAVIGKMLVAALNSVCPDISELKKFPIKNEELVADLRNYTQKRSPETQNLNTNQLPSSGSGVGVLNPFEDNGNQSADSLARSIYAQYIATKEVCHSVGGDSAMDDLRSDMKNLDKWVRSKGFDPDQLWKEADTGSKKGLFRMGGMNSMIGTLPDKSQAWGYCENMIDTTKMQLMSISNDLGSSQQGVEKDF